MERGLGLLAVRNIHQNPGHADRPPAGVVTYAAPGGYPSNLSIPTVDATLNLEAAGLSSLLKRRFDCLSVLIGDVGQ
jgi:hypothetical protein